MPFRLNWEPKGVVIEFTGVVSATDIELAAYEYSGHERFDQLRYVIADYSRIESCIAEPAEIESEWTLEFGAKLSNPYVRKAVVTTHAEVVALAEYYENHLRDAFPTRVLPTLAEARTWACAK